MMNDYAETKKELDRIRDEYGCQGEIIFRTALQYIVEHGQSTFNDNGFVDNQLVLIDVKHDKAEAEGKTCLLLVNLKEHLLNVQKRLQRSILIIFLSTFRKRCG